MSVKERLADVLDNLSRSRKAIQTNLETARKAVDQLDDESLASIHQLLDKFEHPQSIGQFVTAVAQADGLAKTAAEMDVAVAILEKADGDDEFLSSITVNVPASTAERTPL